MRKMIETTSTLILWAVWIIGSGLAVSDCFSKAEIAKKVTHHLWIVAWSPVIAVGVFAVMLIAVRRSKNQTTKKTIPNEHTILWTAEDLANAQSGKVIDLYFAGAGLDCQVVARDEAALVLHTENQTMHVTVAAQAVDESVITRLQQAF